jgi:hypothetical protein
VGFVDEAPDPSRIREGAWIVAGSGTARAVAQVADVEVRSFTSGPCPDQ